MASTEARRDWSFSDPPSRTIAGESFDDTDFDGPSRHLPAVSRGQGLPRQGLPRQALDALFVALKQFVDRRQARLFELPATIAFLGRYGVPPRALRAAAERAARIQASPHEVLIASGLVTEEQYLDLVADRTGIERLRDDTQLDPVQAIEPVLAERIARVTSNEGETALVIVPSPVTLGWLLSGALPPPGLRLLLASETEFRARMMGDLCRVLDRHATVEAIERSGVRPARLGLTNVQFVCSAALAVALPVLLWAATDRTLTIMIALLSVLFIGHSVLRLAAVFARKKSLAACPPLAEADLPAYTVLVALHDEARIVPQLIRALRGLDYSPEKLDIVLIVEAHDEATQSALERQVLPAFMRVIVAPPSSLKTKPRALNFALLFAQGDLVTIFDAEDEPEPDQLRKAAAIFAHHPEIDCLQASLVPDNADDGLIQGLFALEYAGLFDVVQSGLSALDLPLPLGGTSNHFRQAPLKEAGGWDAFNVTEDAELGLRFWRRGQRIGKLDSVTYEEAPSTFRSWFNQRRRWSKGWLQTAISQSAHPSRDMRRFGIYRTLLPSFVLITTLLSMLIYPFGIIALITKLVFGAPLFSGGTMQMALDTLIVLVVALGLTVMVLPVMLSLRQRGLVHLAPLVLTVPVYQLAISLASWVALYDLSVAPFEWLKTEHGFARSSLRRSVSQKASTVLTKAKAGPAGLFRSR